MTYLLIPNEVNATDARVWVAAINEKNDLTAAALECGGQQPPLDANWFEWVGMDGRNRIRYQRVTIKNLNPRETYALKLRVGGELKADASVTTLPSELPTVGQTPFTVFLGSCFYKREDEAGEVGKTYMSLPFGARPEVKILCGDQVYLDNPWHHFLKLQPPNWLENRSFKSYLDAWTQSTPNGGFHQLLKNNANYFCSDDHEFWNNAPDVGLNVPLFTATKPQRDSWFRIARRLYEVFQTDWPVKALRVGALSIGIVDTRINRASGRANFMEPKHLDLLGEWIRNLPGPGALVIGQPLLEVKGSIKDWGLPDYPQYQELIRHLRAAQHSIVILTGDVHFGRIASCDLRPELGTKLIEIISSPMQLVPGAPGTFKEAPRVFGPVTTEAEFWDKKNHFLTLEFNASSSQRVRMQVKYWPIMKNGSPLQSKAVGTFELI